MKKQLESQRTSTLAPWPTTKSTATRLLPTFRRPLKGEAFNTLLKDYAATPFKNLTPQGNPTVWLLYGALVAV
jgi:hypothetical protein